MSYTKHHLLFPRTVHEALIPTRKLRQLQQHVPPVDEQIEDALHRNLVAVPSLDYYVATTTLKELQPSKTYIGSVYNLMNAIERAGQHPKCQPLQREVAQLTIHALEMQIPFLRSGLMTTEVGVHFERS